MPPGARHRSLPTFIGIGAPRAGTTWIYQTLDSHPDVVMSHPRKEVNYFDHHYDKGLDWYGRFFVSKDVAAPHAVGEFSPNYLYGPSVPARVRSVPSIDRFILIVRNPVDRAFSHFRFRRRQDNISASFEEFLDKEPRAVALGWYGRHLSEWFDAFDPSKFLVLIFEEAIADPAGVRRQLSQHLALDPSRFPEDGRAAPVNEAFVPERGDRYAAAIRKARWLRERDLDWVITAAKRSGVVAWLRRSQPPREREDVPEALRRKLWDQFEEDVAVLEELLGRSLQAWRPTGD